MHEDHAHVYDNDSHHVQWVRLPQPGAVTILDYFAAHAPKDPQHWFTPKMDPPELPKHQSFDQDGMPIDAKRAQVIRDTEGADAISSNYTERAKWTTDYEVQRMLQWPYAWAMEQCKVRQQLMTAAQ